ncbi:MAG: hypothetical protein WBV73_01295 [Phormidium sp.]
MPFSHTRRSGFVSPGSDVQRSLLLVNIWVNPPISTNSLALITTPPASPVA